MSSSRSLLALRVSILLGLVVLLGSVYALRLSASDAYHKEVHLRATRVLTDSALKGVLDAETGIRGYDVSHDKLFLEPYDQSETGLPRAFTALGRALAEEGLSPTAAERAGLLHARWERDVALPSLANADGPVVLKLGKTIVDQIRAQVASVQAELDTRQVEIDRERRAALDRIAFFSTFVIIAMAAGGLIFGRRQVTLERRLERQRAVAVESRVRTSELRAAYEAEKRIADSLQDAIAQRPLPLHPTLRFSATYVPATEEARVGGDWYDAIELPQNRVLFAIGDVTGHGLEAAVTMSRARQALVTSALYDSEPAMVLARVNDDLLGQKAPMVTAVAGFADARSYEFVYASAGHPPPVLLEPNRPPRLLDFGGVPLGVVAGATFATHRIQSVPGAMLILYTDGAVEHTRNVLEGETLLLDSIARAAETPSDDAASVIHRNIFHGNPAGDDVAILTIGFGGEKANTLLISADDAQTSVNSRIERDANATPIDVARARRGARPTPPLPRRLAS